MFYFETHFPEGRIRFRASSYVRKIPKVSESFCLKLQSGSVSIGKLYFIYFLQFINNDIIFWDSEGADNHKGDSQ